MESEKEIHQRWNGKLKRFAYNLDGVGGERWHDRNVNFIKYLKRKSKVC